MSNLLKRTLSALVYVAIFMFSVLFSSKTYIGLIAVFTVIALWEFKKIILFKSILPYFILAIVLFFAQKASNKILLFTLALTLLCSVRLLFHLYSKNKTYPSLFISKLDLCIRYIILPFIFLMLLPFVNGTYQPNIIIFITILIWTNDSFAFLVGKNFGKTKLFERVSPKKTIEGFIGGLVFAIIAGAIIGAYTNNFSVVNGIIIAVITAIFGTLGDLVESKFKRQANVKDSGNIMPGHGGILDRLDSLFFVAPFVYLYIHFLN